MYTRKTLFAQVMDFLPWTTFHRMVQRYQANHRIRTLPCTEQFRVMAFAQLAYRESLRDIESCLAAQARKLYAGESLGVELDNTVYALDAATIDLCLSMFPWGAFYVMDRGDLDVERLYRLDQAGSFFVTRAKRNMDARRLCSTTRRTCVASAIATRIPARAWCS